jgi:hypothetical protein
MPVVIVGAEKSFAALRGRLFQKKPSAAAARLIEEAIREANPHVDLADLVPGTVISVPRLPGIDLDVEGVVLDPTSRGFVGDVHREVRDALAALVTDAERRDAEEASERKQLARLLRGREVQGAAGQDGDLAAQLAAAAESLEEQAATSKQALATLRATASSWDEELAVLAELLG